MILSWLQNRFEEVVMASNDEEARVNCPFCLQRVGSDDTKYHLYVNMLESKAHCFRCEWSGNWASLIMQASDVSYVDALAYTVRSKPHVGKFGRMTARLPQISVISKPEGFKTLVGGPSKMWDMEMLACWAYLLRRVKSEVIDYRFGSISGTNRVWFLVDDGYWTGRAIINTEPRYLNPNAKKADVLWNWQALKPKACIIVTEGIFGAISNGSIGVALLGKSITKQQAARIVNSQPSMVTVMLDRGCYAESFSVGAALLKEGLSAKALHYYWLEQPQPTDSLDGMEMQHDWCTPALVKAKWIL
jgi:hypothetical protein